MRNSACLALLIMSGCSTPSGPYPSLHPRAAENVDPRIPVTRPMNDRPVTPALASRLSGLVALAQSGSATFDGTAAEAEHRASAAGSPQSEGWIAAQEALTAAIAAREPTTDALGDIDEIGATALQTQSGIAPNDLAAIQKAAAIVGALEERQAARIHAIQLRLGL